MLQTRTQFQVTQVQPLFGVSNHVQEVALLWGVIMLIVVYIIHHVCVSALVLSLWKWKVKKLLLLNTHIIMFALGDTSYNHTTDSLILNQQFRLGYSNINC